MSRRKVLLACFLCLLCAPFDSGPARAQQKAADFDPAMTLEETVAWLGARLNHSWEETSADGGLRRRFTTRTVKAKGCKLSYSTESQVESAAGEPTQAAVRSRELWTIDLAGLDPWMVRPAGPRRVLFSAAGAKSDSIRTSVFRDHSEQASNLTVHHNRRAGSLTVEEKQAAGVADALRHAVELCRR